MKKHEWRKDEKDLYLPKSQPQFVDVPELQFVTISGQGNPNGPDFAECITALYSTAYAIKMNLKKVSPAPKGYRDFTVYPLEGVWDLSEKGRKSYKGAVDKDELIFKIMLRQPDFVSGSFFKEMLELTKKKKATRQTRPRAI